MNDQRTLGSGISHLRLHSLSVYLSLSSSFSPPFSRSPGCINRWKSGRSGAAGVRNSGERKAESVRYREDFSKSWNSSVVNNNKRALAAPTVIFPVRKRNENNDEQEGTTIRYGLSGKPGSARSALYVAARTNDYQDRIRICVVFAL